MLLKGQLISERIDEVIIFSQNTNKNLSGAPLTTQGRNPDNFAFVFWEKL